MKVLYLCDEYPPGKNGGIGTAVQVVSRELAKQGHSVFVVGLYAHSYGESDYELDQSVNVWRLRYGPNFGTWETGYKIYRKLPALVNRYWKGRSAFAAYWKFIEDLVRKENIDIIESPDWNTFSMFIGFVPQWPKLNIPFLIRSHGSFTYFQTELHEPANRHMQLCDLALFKRADGISSVSSYTAKLNQQLFNLKTEGDVIPNSVHVSRHVDRDNVKNFQIFFSGALIEKKGIFSLVKAWNIVHQKLPNARLLIYGKGKFAPLQSLLSSTALTSVEFGGHVSRDKVFSALTESALAVFPSYSETFGIMCIEAMAVQCPVIYTKRSCGPEIVIDGQSGELVDPDDIEEIANAILKLLSNRDLAVSYATNAHARALLRYDTTEVVKQHLAFYEKQINAFKLGHPAV